MRKVLIFVFSFSCQLRAAFARVCRSQALFSLGVAARSMCSIAVVSYAGKQALPVPSTPRCCLWTCATSQLELHSAAEQSAREDGCSQMTLGAAGPQAKHRVIEQIDSACSPARKPTVGVHIGDVPPRSFAVLSPGEWGDFGSPADGMICIPVTGSTSGKCPRTVLVGSGTKKNGVS